MATSMRNRVATSYKNRKNFSEEDVIDEKYKQRENIFHSELLWFFIFLFYALIYQFIHVRNGLYPESKTLASEKPGDFIEERAFKHLIDITNFGPRVVGGEANEKLVVAYLLKEIKDIKQGVNNSHHIEYDIQTTTGSFSLPFLSPFTSFYDSVQNIIVKLSPSTGAPDSLLVNCHYDTVLDSPGASDDAVTCCLMLEVLRVLSKRPTRLKHNIVFIFNGAEENILQASHGFITQHKWAREVRAFVNLEGAGAGGRELLFQAGPGHPWILQTYAESVPHPFASVFAQEVFESGIIPADTDYRIYRDFGGLPGVDIAYIHNGYVYHTRFDTPDQIPKGCIQRGGENLLALVTALANSPLLSKPGEYRHGSLVFFDVVGMFMVAYPARIGYIINTVIALLTAVSILSKARGTAYGPGFRGKMYGKHLFVAICVNLVSWLVTCVLVMCLGFLMHHFGQPMSWYTHNWIMIGLYILPAIMVIISVHSLAKCRLYITVNSMWDVESIYFDSFLLTLSVLLLILTYYGINSAVILLIFILFPLVIRDRISTFFKISLRDHPLPYLCLHMVSVLPPSLIYLYVMYAVFTMFTPLMGRIGSEVIPDVFIAGICITVVIILMGYQVNFVYVSGSTKHVLMVLAVLSAVSFLAASFTSVGFPYRVNPQQPSRQRHIVKHTERTFHDINDTIIKHDSQIWHIPFDNYGIFPLKPLMTALKDVEEMPCTPEAPYCGLPYYFPMAGILKKSHYIPAAPVKVKSRPKYRIVNRHLMKHDNLERLTISVTGGPSHQSVFLMPRDGIDIVRWSLGDGLPIPGITLEGAERETYFIYYSRGLKQGGSWQFWIDVQYQGDMDSKGGLLDIALCGHYFHEDRMQEDLSRYLKAMPDWTVPVGWTVTYESWVI